MTIALTGNWREEIKAILIQQGFGGTGTEAKKDRIALLQEIFQTGSWTKIESMPSEKIKAGCLRMRAKFEPPAVESETATVEKEAT